jgi:predicted MFS family arabinose efflux permease
VSATLFLSLFASQAGLIAVSPVLAELAGDLGVSTAVAGQLRTVTGVAAAATALLLPRVAGRVGLGRQLLVATSLLALGSLASAAAPTFGALALAQIPVGVAVGILTTAATLAAAEWAPEEARAQVLSWALVGQPAAWIVGMPVIGMLGERSWRYGWLALPLLAALLASAALSPRRAEPPAAIRAASLRAALADRRVSRWLGSELLANSAWAATIVYSGALFAETYGTSTTGTGIVLAIGAGAYVVGNQLTRRLPPCAPLRSPTAIAIPLVVTSIPFGAFRPSLPVSAALFAAAALAAGSRTLVSTAYGLSVSARLRPAAMGGRAATMQLGYVGGAGIGGLALLAGGYTTLGLVIGALFFSAALVLAPSSGPVAFVRASWLVHATTALVASSSRYGLSVTRSGGGQARRFAARDRGRKAARSPRDPAPACQPHGWS